MKTILTILAIAFPVAIMAIPAQAAVPTGDFDGDGRSDVFWRNMSTGANSIWKSANIADPAGVVSVTNLNWYIAGQGDFDGDGRADVFWRNADTGANVIWKAGNAATKQAVVGVTDGHWNVALVGDFDGDGRTMCSGVMRAPAPTRSGGRPTVRPGWRCRRLI